MNIMILQLVALLRGMEFIDFNDEHVFLNVAPCIGFAICCVLGAEHEVAFCFNI